MHLAAGRQAAPPKEMLIDLARLEREYYERRPDPADPDAAGQLRHQRPPRLVAATARSPRRTSSPSPRRSATTGARTAPTARSTWARTRTRCPAPAQRTALEVLAANGVETIIQRDDGVTPTPVISRAILVYNRGRKRAPRRRHRHHAVAQSAARTAASSTTRPTAARPTPTSRDWIEDRANDLLRDGQRRREARAVRSGACKAATTHQDDFVLPYVDDLRNVVDMDAIRAAGLKLGVDPLGGAALALLGADQLDLRPRHRRRQSRRSIRRSRS